MLHARVNWVRFSEQFNLVRARSFCSNSKKGKIDTSKSIGHSGNAESNVSIHDERYRQLENLDFMTAAKILFTDPPKKRNSCLISISCNFSLLAFLPWLYTWWLRSGEEEEAKELELNPLEENVVKSDPQLLKVKERLDKLEEAVKEIVVETKNQSSSSQARNQVNDDQKKKLEPFARSDTGGNSSSTKAAEKDHRGKHVSAKLQPEFGHESIKGSKVAPNASLQDKKGKHHGGETSQGTRN
ncbi:hypothetical protein L6164_022282 [Bauhinia variegata]|uniref:Uncharacterized protein n=1 Tax=Bauhinia variegata TaxID=167791 RepID=A0ACB9MFP6_BAUVA|nr:hypothetical protein L6164_022282 [Bauhinia variegata]